MPKYFYRRTENFRESAFLQEIVGLVSFYSSLFLLCLWPNGLFLSGRDRVVIQVPIKILRDWNLSTWNLWSAGRVLKILSSPVGFRMFFVFFLVPRDSGVSASRDEFPVSLRNHVGFTPWSLYSSTHHFPESFTHLTTGWAQDAWLQWSYEKWYFHRDIGRWPSGSWLGKKFHIPEKNETQL